MTTVELVKELREASATWYAVHGKHHRLLLRAADRLEALEKEQSESWEWVRKKLEAERCEHCGSDRLYSGPPDCPICGAPNCCTTCCRITHLEADCDHLAKERGELREQLAKWNGLALPDEVDASPEGVLVFIGELIESDDGACRAWGDANERAEKAEAERDEARTQLSAATVTVDASHWRAAISMRDGEIDTQAKGIIDLQRDIQRERAEVRRLDARCEELEKSLRKVAGHLTCCNGAQYRGGALSDFWGQLMAMRQTIEAALGEKSDGRRGG